MAERSVVVTGASRGLGLATAAHLHRKGWTVLAAMRSPDEGLARLRDALGGTTDDRRLVGVRLDLEDHESIGRAAQTVRDAVGAPDGLVHNAGMAGVGCVEEMPADVVERMFSTNVFGPIRLTKELLPAMRAAGRGRIVAVSSQGGLRGMPAISAYSATKGALERWAESLSQEVAAFGIGVTVLVTGTFKTDILEKTETWADAGGPYADHHAGILRAGDSVVALARPPERFAPAVERALEESSPFTRHAVGLDAKLMLWADRALPYRFVRWGVGRFLRLPPPRSGDSAQHK